MQFSSRTLHITICFYPESFYKIFVCTDKVTEDFCTELIKSWYTNDETKMILRGLAAKEFLLILTV